MTRLDGRGVAVTRAEPAGGPLERRLAARGARVVRWSAISIAPAGDPGELAAALERIAAFDWLVVTSAHAAAAVTARLATPPPGLRVAAVGPGTADELAAAGWRVDRLGRGGGADGLVRAFAAAGDSAGARVLFPAGSLAGGALAAGLGALGARVERVEAYRTLPSALDVDACRAALERGEVEAVTFASPSAAGSLARALGAATFRDLARRAAVASIGPTTSAALARLGRAPDAEARPSTLDGLVEAVAVALAVHPCSHRTDAVASVPVGGPSR